MSRKKRSVPAGEFKATCLTLLDHVAERGVEYVVTKRGKPVAKVVSVDPRPPADLRGSILWEGDILSPIDAGWEGDS